jgi:hexulose-6-phosphate isomerase
MAVWPSIRPDALAPARTWPQRFRLAAEAGFKGVEASAEDLAGNMAEIKAAAAANGLVIHSVHTRSNWTHPLSSADPERRAAGVRATLAALETAAEVGADTLMLVPGIVDETTSYSEAWERSQEAIRRNILPLAERLGIILGVENVWHGFLLSPTEYVRYIDEFESPWVKAYLDLGNMVFGHVDDWIDAAGPRIVKLHLKDFRLDTGRGRFRWYHLGEGDIDWASARAALDRAGFDGWGTLADAQHMQGRVAGRIWRASVRDKARLARLPGGARLLGAGQTWLARRVLDRALTGLQRNLG